MHRELRCCTRYHQNSLISHCIYPQSTFLNWHYWQKSTTKKLSSSHSIRHSTYTYIYNNIARLLRALGFSKIGIKEGKWKEREPVDQRERWTMVGYLARVERAKSKRRDMMSTGTRRKSSGGGGRGGSTSGSTRRDSVRNTRTTTIHLSRPNTIQYTNVVYVVSWYAIWVGNLGIQPRLARDNGSWSRWYIDDRTADFRCTFTAIFMKWPHSDRVAILDHPPFLTPLSLTSECRISLWGLESREREGAGDLYWIDSMRQEEERAEI